MSLPAQTAEGRAHPHLLAAGAALLLFVLLLDALQFCLQRRLPSEMRDFAAHASLAKLNGNVLQTEAFRLPDSLPIYGSSELEVPADNRPDAFFRDHPTGFTVFPIGRPGTT